MSVEDAQPTDTTTGTLKESEPIIWSSHRQAGKRWVKTFKRTYQHYFTSASTPCTSTEVPVWSDSTANCVQINNGEYIIPYHNVGVSTFPQEYQSMLTNVGRVRVLSLGFEVTRATVCQEQVNTTAAATVMNNSFESTPFYLQYTDKAHLFDYDIGLTTGGNARAAGCCWANSFDNVNPPDTPAFGMPMQPIIS